MRARPLALKLAKSFSSRLEPYAHVVPRHENSLYCAKVILIFHSLMNKKEILKNGYECMR